jgi:cytochrome c oxidase assembly protein subunit 15
VSPYRLAAHLSTAFAIYTAILWSALDVAWPTPPRASPALSPARIAAALAARRRAHPLAGLIALTALSGAFVAGLDAGHAYNTFPLMGGRIVPEEYWAEGLSFWHNTFENTAAVQFHHRVLALSTLAGVGGAWAASVAGAAAAAAPLPAAAAVATHALAAAAATQVSLGIATLLSCVPVWLGAAHQAGALTLFSAAIVLLHTLRAPPAVKARALAAAKAAATTPRSGAAAAGMAAPAAAAAAAAMP